MTEPAWATHEPPWLAKLHPELVDEPDATGERTPEQRAAYLVEQLERAAAGRVPPALVGAGWTDAEIAEYGDQPAKPVIRERVPGPYPCQLPEPVACDRCGGEFSSKVALAVHQAGDNPHVCTQRQRRAERADRATKPKPGARKRKSKRRR